MPNYRVIWEINIEADSPEEAVKKALNIQRDFWSTATTFEVTEKGSDKTQTIDGADLE